LIESIFSTQQQENRGEQCKNKENQLSRRRKKKRRLLFGSLSCDCPDMRRWVPAAPANHISKKQ